MWVYRPGVNTWQRMAIDPPPGVDARAAAGQNRAVVYDPARELVLLVLGPNNHDGSLVYALHHRDDQAKPFQR